MASYRLKRKTYAFLGIGNMMKNWNAGGFVNKAKAIGTGAVYAGGGFCGNAPAAERPYR